MPTILLSVAEKAVELGISTETLRRWRHEGVGPKYVEYGTTVRYFPEAVPAMGNSNDSDRDAGLSRKNQPQRREMVQKAPDASPKHGGVK